MHWKFRAGSHEQTGVCLQRHCAHNGTGGYTREPQHPGQCCDCQSLTREVATGLPPRRGAFGAADPGVDRPRGAPRAHGVRCERWGLRSSCLYDWQRACVLHGLERVRYRHGGGRRPQCTPKPRQRLGERLEAGPLVVGGETACWDAVRIRGLRWRAFGVLSHRPYVCPFLHHVGFSWPQARCVSDHLATVTRLVWLEQTGPTMVRTAKRRRGLRLCADEASGAPGGSWISTWARRGQQPEVPTRGQRKGSKVFGAMAYVSGRLCSQGLAGRVHAASSQAFRPMILAQTTPPLCLLPDGARYPTSASTHAFLVGQSARRTAKPLPS
jgi:transposase